MLFRYTGTTLLCNERDLWNKDDDIELGPKQDRDSGKNGTKKDKERMHNASKDLQSYTKNNRTSDGTSKKTKRGFLVTLAALYSIT